MITKDFVFNFFQAAYIQRWNDKLRPIEFTELDKHAHTLFIAYVLGRFEERKKKISWNVLIEESLFSCLEKIVLTDIKSPVLYAIRTRPDQYLRLMDFVSKEVSPFLASVDSSLANRFGQHLTEDATQEKRLLSAASILASIWEFDIIERANPHGFEMSQIREALLRRVHEYEDLQGIQEIQKEKGLQGFVDLCGQLRFQARWAHVHRIPKTSVLGHCYFVAMISYLYSLSLGACGKRIYNNTFGGLFHDLPEVLTRDIIAPVKRSSEGLRELIIEYEKEQMAKIVYPLLPSFFHDEIHLFTELDAENSVQEKGQRHIASLDEINRRYNTDEHDPCDGEIVKAADELSAYIESIEAIKNGCVSEKFIEAKTMIAEKYIVKGIVGGIDFGGIYKEMV
ncbi:HD domain-containing protein [Candidatus Uhrbacteria bacterium]|nr:HD domain-containing protein [Candidatus Uhrbacteria bacterium]